MFFLLPSTATVCAGLFVVTSSLTVSQVNMRTCKHQKQVFVSAFISVWNICLANIFLSPFISKVTSHIHSARMTVENS